MRKFSWFNPDSGRKRKVVVRLESAPDPESKEKDDARALELMRIFADADPVAFQGKLEHRTVR
ncbi:hypothetical protein [Burkholderia gladioli]|uniref:hypothetical protein n=1 Tax=Burkholderia gladioli TaxID=28095 RepID=UPI0016406EB3|nr:hypothetical protein [Burkholderia gladioli]